MDHRINRRHFQRVATHQQRLETEHLPHLVALEIFLDQRKQRPDRVEFDQIGKHPEHLPDAAEIGIAKLQKAALENRPRGFVELLIPFEILGRELGNLFAHPHRIGIIIEIGHVVEIDAVKWQDRDDLHIFRRVRPAAHARHNALALVKNVRRKIRLAEHRAIALERKQLLDKMRHRQHRWPHVEHKPLGAAHIGAAPRRIEFFDNLRIETQTLQPHGARYAANARPDNNCLTPTHLPCL